MRGGMRSPRTTQERRANGRRGKTLDGIRVRLKRSMQRLVEAWDDLVIGRSGKKKRRRWKRT